MEKPQSTESYPPRRQSESLSALRSALEEARNANDNDSNPDNDDDASQDEASGSPDKPARRPKRARACIACRNMKIRCLPVDGQDACLGCSKVNRECIMPGPARKRQKTVHKVAELEKKINALTDALIAQQAANPTPPNDSPMTDRQETQSDVTRTNTVTTVTSDPQREAERPQYDRSGPNKPLISVDKTELNWGCSQFEHPAETLEPYADIIERGLVDMSTATRIFDHYVLNMLGYFPVIHFPKPILAQDVRTARPMLFLAILTVAAPAIKPELHPNLVIELTRQLSERILFLGEKSLEIVQSILVYTSCYSRGKYAKDLTFNQLIHSAVVMCLDLGMGKRYKSQHLEAREEAEIRRTWLACFYFASNVSILLRHPSLVRWTPYLEDCVSYLCGPDAPDSDRWLCAMARTQQLAEEVSLVFNMDDPSSNISFGDTSTQYHLKVFEKQLAAWNDSIPSSIDPNIVTHLSSSLNLYMHEIAIHNDHNIDEFKPGPTDMTRSTYGSRSTTKHYAQPTSSTPFVTTTHIDALAQCVDSSHSALDAWLAMPVQTARTVPNLGIVWNTYAIVALIKLHGVIHCPDSKFGEVFSPDLKIDYYLLAVIERLQEVSADGRCPPAEAFVYVVRKLRSWFEHKRSGFPEASDEDSVDDPKRKDGGFVVSHKEHANDVMKIAQSRYNMDVTQSPSQQAPSLESTSAPFVPATTGQPSQGLVGTSSMPSSQLNPGIGMMGFSSSQAPANAFTLSSQNPGMSDLNMAYNAANYNINWDELNFSHQEMNLFDEYMGERSWMTYLI